MLTDQDTMSNIYRGPSIDAFYQVLVHLVKWFQRVRFLEIDQPETRIVYGLLSNRNRMRNLYRELSIDASYMYQVSVHLSKRFQRRIFKCEKLTDDK